VLGMKRLAIIITTLFTLTATASAESDPKKVEARNLIANASICESYFSADNVDFFKKLIQDYSLVYAIKDHYLFSTVGNDGRESYPDIEVTNICSTRKTLPITDILDTGKQLSQIHIKGDLLYVMQTYPSVLQVISIKDIENIQVLGEYRLDVGLGPNFAIEGQYAYIAVNKTLLILDVSSPSDIKKHTTVQLVFGEFDSDGIAVNNNQIFITGNNVLKVINKKTLKLIQELNFDFRTSDVIVKNNYIYVLGWRNNFLGSKIAVLDFNDGQTKLRNVVETEKRIFSFKLIDNYLVGQEIFKISKDGNLVRL